MKIIGIGLFVAAFILFAQTVGPLSSAYQAEFDQWALAEEKRIAEILSSATTDPSVDKLVGNAAEKLNLPVLSVTLTSDLKSDQSHSPAGALQVFSVGQNQSPEEGKKILRLLALLREAQVFAAFGSESSAAAPAASDSTAVVATSETSTDLTTEMSSARISVAAADKSFTSKFLAAQARSNPKVLTLLRLFREYANGQPGKEHPQ